MSIQVKGTIDRQGFGPGTWALVTESGETYELHTVPDELKHAGLTVKVSGQVKKDVMTFAMIGPVLEVQGFEILNS
ncbi:MAG: hypothetical protein KME16_23800 [Scytolyngbya sp. HA4215-MV1]|jgi:hypothetical protein|nr:hypothetical protein [Scytolyngbya sp. HA4215-MV1]